MMISLMTFEQVYSASSVELPGCWLMHVPGVGRGPTAQKRLREVVLAIAKRHHGGDIVLAETTTGPRLLGADWDISFTYDGDDGWIAWSRNGRIGVDAERIRPIPEAKEIAEEFFAGQRDGYPDADLETAFIRRWTALEASHKALGTGLGACPSTIPLKVSHCLHGDVMVAVAQ